MLKNHKILSADKGAQIIFEALNEQARFIGGCVRDLLNDEQIADIDIATIYTPDEVIKKLQKHKIKHINIGIKHGTVGALIDKKLYEITSLRQDIDCTGRHAKVIFTTDYKEDAARRDFTINAISMDMEGNIYDYHGGIEDIKNKKLRFIGDADQRCKEDYLRILRFFRFYAKLDNYKFEDNSLKACINNQQFLLNLSAQRVAAELFKILEAKNNIRALKLLEKYNFNKYIFFQEKIAIKEFENFLKTQKKFKIKIDKIYYLAILLSAEKLDHAKIDNIAKKLCLSAKDKKKLNAIIDIKPVNSISIEDHYNIIYEVNIKEYIDLIIINYFNDPKFKEFLKLAKKLKNWKKPVFPLSGKDLQNLNIKPGPEYKKILEDAIKWWQKHKYTKNFDEIIKYIKNRNNIN